jgi:dethiobiotin synthetase
MKKFFITSSGTDIGKTFITSALTYQLKAAGHSVAAYKPIITGFQDGKPNDTVALLEAQGLNKSHKNVTLYSPWRFKMPASPDIAAAAEKEEIKFIDLANFHNSVAKKTEFTLFEGAGGVMAPLNAEKTTLDLISHLKFNVILVVGSYLGSISHTLTAYNALKSKGIADIKIVVSESAKNPNPLEQTVNTVANFTDCEIMVVPRVASENYKYVPDITGLVL